MTAVWLGGTGQGHRVAAVRSIYERYRRAPPPPRRQAARGCAGRHAEGRAGVSNVGESRQGSVGSVVQPSIRVTNGSQDDSATPALRVGLSVSIAAAAAAATAARPAGQSGPPEPDRPAACRKTPPLIACRTTYGDRRRRRRRRTRPGRLGVPRDRLAHSPGSGAAGGAAQRPAERRYQSATAAAPIGTNDRGISTHGGRHGHSGSAAKEVLLPSRCHSWRDHKKSLCRSQHRRIVPGDRVRAGNDNKSRLEDGVEDHLGTVAATGTVSETSPSQTRGLRPCRTTPGTSPGLWSERR